VKTILRPGLKPNLNPNPSYVLLRYVNYRRITKPLAICQGPINYMLSYNKKP